MEDDEFHHFGLSVVLIGTEDLSVPGCIIDREADTHLEFTLGKVNILEHLDKGRALVGRVKIDVDSGSVEARRIPSELHVVLDVHLGALGGSSDESTRMAC